MTVANQQQDSEVTALRAVISLANETLFDLINATIAANYTARLSALNTAYSGDPNNVCPQAHLLSCALLLLLLLPLPFSLLHYEKYVFGKSRHIKRPEHMHVSRCCIIVHSVLRQCQQHRARK